MPAPVAGVGMCLFSGSATAHRQPERHIFTMSTTNVTLVGNICSKLELKDIPANKGMSATQVCTFRVACDKKIPTGQTDEDNRPIYDSADVLYIGVECWGELAKNVNSTLNIGSPVVISGKIVTSSWEEKVEGDKTVRRSIIRCRAYHVGPDLLREAFISRGEMMDLAEETAQKRLKKLVEQHQQQQRQKQTQQGQQPQVNRERARVNPSSNAA
ncbi:single-stranded DNA-binding protein [Corynebacterium glucuronolyticum]|nr:single-stranded DNA-binding protein [Corynebacterium sp. HMSC073D01]QQU89056.1 single-stranded DNA-binding protein [Corynebacterium glucuronolyticum]